MPRYRVTNRITKETFEVEAPFAQNACERLGWEIGNCHVKLLRESPFTNPSAHPKRIDPGQEPLSNRIEKLEERVQRLEELICLMDRALEGVYFRK